MFLRGIVSIKTKSPEQYNDEINTEEKFRKKSEIEGSIVVFDEMLDYNQKQTEQFF